jgi:hypothetical protein
MLRLEKYLEPHKVGGYSISVPQVQHPDIIICRSLFQLPVKKETKNLLNSFHRMPVSRKQAQKRSFSTPDNERFGLGESLTMYLVNA